MISLGVPLLYVYVCMYVCMCVCVYKIFLSFRELGISFTSNCDSELIL